MDLSKLDPTKPRISENKDIMKYWDKDRNIELGLDAKALTYKSKQRAYWICPTCKKQWRKLVFLQVRDNNCPYCTNTMSPSIVMDEDLISEWDYTKNNELKLNPEELSCSSHKKAWWICKKCGCSYIQTIRYNFIHKNFCPACNHSGHNIIPGINDLATTHPNLMNEWDFKKNILKPTEVSHGSFTKVWWKCKTCGHSWKTSICYRTDKKGGTRCPHCARKVHVSFPEQAVFYYIQQVFTDVISCYQDMKNNITELDIYIPSINVAIEYDGYYWHKDKTNMDKAKEKACKKLGIKLYRIRGLKNGNLNRRQNIFSYKHKDENALEQIIKEIITELSGNNAITIDIAKDRYVILSLFDKIKLENSLAVKNPEVATEWHSTKNLPLTPEDISCGSSEKVWWLGKCGHEWQSSICDRAGKRHRGCPYCAGQKILPGFNDFASYTPRAVKYWSKNNKKRPTEFTPHTNKKALFICECCGAEFERRCKEITIGVNTHGYVLCKPCRYKILRKKLDN